jgi:hypothetical protein
MNISRVLCFGLAFGALVTGCADRDGNRSVPGQSARPAMPFEQADLDRSGDLSTQEAVLVPGLDVLVVDQDDSGTIARDEYEAWAGGARRKVPETAGAGDAKR